MEDIDLEALAEKRHPPDRGEWVTIRELPNGTGWVRDRRFVDVAAFNAWPSSGGFRVAYEIKRTRSDFLSELERPTKRQWAEERFHECWFVTLPKVCDPREVPEGWGLLVPTKKGDKLRKLRVAQQRKPQDLKPTEWLAALRMIAKDRNELRRKMFYFDGKEITKEKLAEIVEGEVSISRELIEKERQSNREYRQELNEYRRRLEEPFQVLGIRTFGRIDWRYKDITADAVRKWLDDLEKNAIERVKRPILDAHKHLGKLIDKIEGANDG